MLTRVAVEEEVPGENVALLEDDLQRLEAGQDERAVADHRVKLELQGLADALK